MAGYSLHIERKEKVTIDEWLKICEQDKTLTIQHVLTEKNPNTGEKIEFSTPNSCIWKSPILKKEYIFHYSNGSITLSTNKAQIKKAKAIAKLLNARIIGDEGEEY